MYGVKERKSKSKETNLPIKIIFWWNTNVKWVKAKKSDDKNSTAAFYVSCAELCLAQTKKKNSMVPTWPGKSAYSVSSETSTAICLPCDNCLEPSRTTDWLFSFPMLSHATRPLMWTTSWESFSQLIKLLLSHILK